MLNKLLDAYSFKAHTSILQIMIQNNYMYLNINHKNHSFIIQQNFFVTVAK